MPETEYTYAVARIRSKELNLLTSQTVEQLLAAKSYDECIRILTEKGWGSSEKQGTADSILTYENNATWDLISELVDDMSVFDVFLYANDYHNLKAAIKLVCTNSSAEGAFIKHGTVDYETIYKAVKENQLDLLPESMREVENEAFKALLHTGDGQLCDVIVDKAALDAIYAAGNASKNDLIKEYAELTVAAADIKTAVRCQKTGKKIDFIERALAKCNSLDINILAKAAAGGIDEIYTYLDYTVYSDAVQALKQSPSAFERWCDNLIIWHIRPQKYNPFTVGPLAAYILARENEIKTVRVILSGKLNGLPESTIRERMREMYV
ncbi:MAG: V-type ATPase subunit [Oscillospiraceae bacterium]